MTAQIKAELLKLRSTRTAIALILGMIALILIFTLLDGLLSHPSGVMGKENQRELLSVSSLTGVFSALAGVLLVTSEYRFGTIRPTILFNPVRSQVLAAKVVAGALAGVAFGVVGEAINWAVGYPILEGRGITVVLSGAIIALLAWGLAVDNLLFGLVPSVGRFMPDRASDALMGLREHHLLAPGAGAIILIAWTAALAVVGIALSVRQDIN
jgi:ABC-2 type transport system permease protein